MTAIKNLLRWRMDHLPRVSITFIIVIAYIAIIVLGGFKENFINASNKELMTRLGDAFYLAVAYFLGRESRGFNPNHYANEYEDRHKQDGLPPDRNG